MSLPPLLVPLFVLACCSPARPTKQLNIDLFKKTLGPVQKVMKDADLKLSEVDEIVLVGGSTRIPKVSLNPFFARTDCSACTPDLYGDNTNSRNPSCKYVFLELEDG